MSQPYEGDSTAVNPAGITGRNTAAVGGNGIGVLGTSVNGEAVHGETDSTVFAAIAGYELNPASSIAAVFGQQKGNGPGVFGTSNAGEGVHGETNATGVAAVAGIELNPASTAAAVYGEQRGNGPGVFGLAKGNAAGVFGTSQGYEGVHGETTSNNAAAVGAINKGSSGAAFYGISQGGEGVHGETNSATFAAVAGYALNPNGTGAGVYGESKGKGPAGFFKGNVVVTGDVILSNADCAEDFDMAVPEDATPGAVMALDAEGRLRPTSGAYDKKVVGVISGAGNYQPGIVLDRTSRNPDRMPIALLGKVYAQVDARFGSIQVGDLLTSSPTPGYAMRASDPERAFGSVIGKALASLSSGQGLIPVLISLQ
jgi:hypothetical protein